MARRGSTPLVVAEDRAVLGVIYLKDIVKGGIRERFAELRQMGIKTVMITGDNPVTAATIAARISGATPAGTANDTDEFDITNLGTATIDDVIDHMLPENWRDADNDPDVASDGEEAVAHGA